MAAGIVLSYVTLRPRAGRSAPAQPEIALQEIAIEVPALRANAESVEASIE